MYRVPMASTTISLARLSTRLLAFAHDPQQTRRKLNPRFKQGIGALLLGALLGASQVVVVPAYADEEQLQRQIDAMKRQLEAMQRELAQTRKQSAQQRAGVAQQQASAAPPRVITARNGNEIIIPPP